MTRTVRRGLAALLTACGLIGAAALIEPGPAAALGPGQVCVFNAPTGGNGWIGHDGWGYLIGGTNQWIYGATENYSGARQINPGHDIGYWDRVGNWNQMVGTFSDPSIPTLNHIHRNYYTTYKCYSTSTSSVGAANAAARRPLWRLRLDYQQLIARGLQRFAHLQRLNPDAGTHPQLAQRLVHRARSTTSPSLPRMELRD